MYAPTVTMALRFLVILSSCREIGCCLKLRSSSLVALKHA